MTDFARCYLECGGRAQRRHRLWRQLMRVATSSHRAQPNLILAVKNSLQRLEFTAKGGVALRFPPHSKWRPDFSCGL